MPRHAINILIPLIFLVGVIWLFFREKPKTLPAAEVKQQPAAFIFDESKFLVRPMYGQNQQDAIALAGGQIPAANGQVPSVLMGRNILRPVHLSWVHDWRNPECRSLFKQLYALYSSAQGGSLPALKIYLNPVFTDEAGEELHRAMLQVFFRSRVRENYLILAAEICAGKLAPTAAAIRSRVEQLDNSLITDWDTPLDWLQTDIEHTFTVAKNQQKHNATILSSHSPAQLTSVLECLPTSADVTKITTFLKDAEAMQRIWLGKVKKTDN